jgi:hypothetical protein
MRIILQYVMIPVALISMMLTSMLIHMGTKCGQNLQGALAVKLKPLGKGHDAIGCRHETKQTFGHHTELVQAWVWHLCAVDFCPSRPYFHACRQHSRTYHWGLEMGTACEH